MNDGILQQILGELKSINGRLDNLEQGQARLEQSQAKLERRLERSVSRMEQGFAEVNTRLDSIDALITGIVHHQNEDYGSMQNLRAVVEIHEERFQKIKAI